MGAKDIFGDESADDALDVSDEALEARTREETPEDDLPDASSEGEGEVQEEEPAPAEPTADAEEEPAAEEQQDDPEPDPEPDVEQEDPAVASYLAQIEGKDRDEIARMWAHSQQEVRRKGNQVGTLRQQLEAAMQLEQEDRAAAQQQAQAQQFQPQQQYQPQVDPQELAEAILDRATEHPDEAYRAAVEAAQSGTMHPGIVDAVLDIAHEYDPGVGRRLEREHARATAQETVEQRYGPQMQAQAAAAVRNMMVHEVNSLMSDEQLGEDARTYRDDVQRLVSQDVSFVGDGSQQAVRAGLRRALKVAIGEDPTRSRQYLELAQQQHAAQQREQLNDRKQDAQVESGAPTGDEPVDEAEAMRQAIFNRNAQDPAAAMWS